MKRLNISLALILTALGSFVKSLRKNPVESVSEQSAPDQSNNQSPNHPPQILNAELRLPQAAIDAYYAQQKSSNHLEWGKLIVEVLTLLAVVWYGWVAYRQWGEMINATKEAGRSADAAENAAVAAADAVDFAGENAQLDQRAWIGVKSVLIQGSIQKGSKLEASITVENTGRTPGLKIRVFVAKSTNYPTDKAMNAPAAGPDAYTVLAPNNTMHTSETLSESLSEEDLNNIRSGKPLFIYGRIIYTDIFAKEHTTVYCRFLDKTIFSHCQTFNHMD